MAERPTYIDFLLSFNRRVFQGYYTANEQLLYHTLLMINNDCYWSEWFSKTDEQLTGIMKIGISAMKTARNRLKQKGAIDFVSSRARGTCTQYRICDDFCAYQIKQQTFDRCATDDLQMLDNPTTTLTPIKKKTKTKTQTKNVIPLTPFAGELGDKVNEWLSYKREKGQTYKPTGLKGLITRIERAASEFGERAVITAIDTAIANNWQGFFPKAESDKDNDNPFIGFAGEGDDLF